MSWQRKDWRREAKQDPSHKRVKEVRTQEGRLREGKSARRHRLQRIPICFIMPLRIAHQQVGEEI